MEEAIDLEGAVEKSSSSCWGRSAQSCAFNNLQSIKYKKFCLMPTNQAANKLSIIVQHTFLW